MLVVELVSSFDWVDFMDVGQFFVVRWLSDDAVSFARGKSMQSESTRLVL